MTAKFFGRKVIVQINEFSYEGLRVDASVSRKGGELAQAKISVYNPGRSVAGLALLSNRKTRVRLLAGYGDVPALVFEGNPVKNGVRLERQGGDQILSFECKDGLVKYQDARVSIAVDGDTTYAYILNQALDALGYPRGIIDVPQGSQVGDMYFEGQAMDLVEELAESLSAEVVVTNGRIDFVARSRTTNEGPLFSQARNNIIGQLKKTDKGVEVTSFLEPRLTIASKFGVDDTQFGLFSGFFKVRALKHSISNWGPDFYTTVTGKAYNTTAANLPSTSADRLECSLEGFDRFTNGIRDQFGNILDDPDAVASFPEPTQSLLP